MAEGALLSVVVTVLNEAASVRELHRRVVETLGDRDFELIFVDDGSTDGTFGELRALCADDSRVRAVRLKRNFGQHPAMHAGLVRTRGTQIVTMDGDLQNHPEDIPKLVEALARVDVASGRRIDRADSVGRTLPSRVINGLLRRFTGVPISDFGCAFNAYRRDAIEPLFPSIGKQKFTKALVLASGASVEEVDVAHAASRGGSAYSPLRLIRLALHVVVGFWPQPIQWIGRYLGSTASPTGFTTRTSRGHCLRGRGSCSSSVSRGSSLRSSASISDGFNVTLRTVPSTRCARSCKLAPRGTPRRPPRAGVATTTGAGQAWESVYW